MFTAVCNNTDQIFYAAYLTVLGKTPCCMNVPIFCFDTSMHLQFEQMVNTHCVPNLI